MFGKWQQRQVLITVRTYPVPAAKTAEVSCTAGITSNREWIRLFPINYRRLERDRKFRKYDWVNVRVAKAPDARPESYHVDADSIEVVGHITTAKNWQERRDLILPLKSDGLCHLITERDAQGAPTLGIFKPREIRRLVIAEDAEDWTEDERAKLQRETTPLLGSRPILELQKIPYRFMYEFVCHTPGCRSHALSCIDWEMSESYRGWREKYGDRGWEPKFRQKYEREMIGQNDTHFYVGTIAAHPHRWTIIGLFYPRL